MLYKTLIVPLVIAYAAALHIRLENGDVKCFYEHLDPQKILWARFETTLVNSRLASNPDASFNLIVTVDETFDNDHRALSQQLKSSDEIVFTALESGEHRICLRPSAANSSSMLSVQLSFNISTLRLPEVEYAQKAHDARDRVGRLIARLETLRNNQRAIKAKEKMARDYSSYVHTRVLICSLFQMAVLIISCVMQFKVLKRVFEHRRQP
ncbi:LAFA_0D14862g1_1 [Lachancea sp. 'fantastica']|nr:LAFA_0D14862g1_1 [Lachancea sp. 'fantastica']